jgi:hypothetical protein
MTYSSNQLPAPITGPSAAIFDSAKDGLLMAAAALIFFKDYFITTLGVRVEFIGIAAILIFALLNGWRVGYARIITDWHYMLLLAVIPFIAAISSVNSDGINSSSYFASFVVATLIIMAGSQNFLRNLRFLMWMNFALQLYEVLLGQFIFVYVDEDYEYDEKMLSVGDDSFRAKGLFSSPLNAISVALSLAILQPRAVSGWALLILTSSLGQGRLGLGIGFVGLLVALLGQRSNSVGARMQRLIIGVASVVAAVLLSVIFGSDESIERLLSAASTDNSQNLSRFIIWGVSIGQLLEYDVISHLFGNYGLIKRLVGSAESDWLRLWLDNGLIFMLLYLVPLLLGTVRSARQRRWPEAGAYVLLIFAMMVYPHGQSMPNGTLLWLTVLGTAYAGRRIIDSPLFPARQAPVVPAH